MSGASAYSNRLNWAVLPGLCLVIAAMATLPVAADGHADPEASTGSSNVLVNGRPALRAGDAPATESGAPGDASPSVFINGKPAAVGGQCPNGQPPTASPDVFVNGKPALFCGG